MSVSRHTFERGLSHISTRHMGVTYMHVACHSCERGMSNIWVLGFPQRKISQEGPSWLTRIQGNTYISKIDCKMLEERQKQGHGGQVLDLQQLHLLFALCSQASSPPLHCTGMLSHPQLLKMKDLIRCGLACVVSPPF